MATFDENLFPCCPTAQTPCIINSDDVQPEDPGDHSHEFPEDNNDHSPRDSPSGDDFNSENNQSSSESPSLGPSQPKKLSENDERSNWNDTHIPDVLRDSASSNGNEENPPKSHRPSEPLPKYQKSKDLPYKGHVQRDLAEWKELSRRSE